jgi:hypothetical protein
VCSKPVDPPNSADPAVCALAPTGFSTASPGDEVMAFDFAGGRCLGAVVRYPRLNGQELVFFP